LSALGRDNSHETGALDATRSSSSFKKSVQTLPRSYDKAVTIKRRQSSRDVTSQITAAIDGH